MLNFGCMMNEERHVDIYLIKYGHRILLEWVPTATLTIGGSSGCFMSGMI